MQAAKLCTGASATSVPHHNASLHHQRAWAGACSCQGRHFMARAGDKNVDLWNQRLHFRLPHLKVLKLDFEKDETYPSGRSQQKTSSKLLGEHKGTLVWGVSTDGRESSTLSSSVHTSLTGQARKDSVGLQLIIFTLSPPELLSSRLMSLYLAVFVVFWLGWPSFWGVLSRNCPSRGPTCASSCAGSLHLTRICLTPTLTTWFFCYTLLSLLLLVTNIIMLRLRWRLAAASRKLRLATGAKGKGKENPEHHRAVGSLPYSPSPFQVKKKKKKRVSSKEKNCFVCCKS